MWKNTKQPVQSRFWIYQIFPTSPNPYTTQIPPLLHSPKYTLHQAASIGGKRGHSASSLWLYFWSEKPRKISKISTKVHTLLSPFSPIFPTSPRKTAPPTFGTPDKRCHVVKQVFFAGQERSSAIELRFTVASDRPVGVGQVKEFSREFFEQQIDRK